MAPSVTGHLPYGLELPEEAVVDISYDEWYSWTLLEDHPLRAPPTRCCPGLFEIVHDCYVTARKNWGERLFKGVCLLLLITAVIQLSIMPLGPIHLLPHAQLTEHGRSFGFSHRHAECAAYHLQAVRDGMGESSAVRCIGVKVDIWMQNGSLSANNSMTAVSALEVLSGAYFKSMLEELGTMDSHLDSLVRSAEAGPLGLFDQEAERSSVLLLELRSPVEAAWLDLTSLLEKLRTERYLSYMNGTRLLVRPVTVVISSKTLSYLDRTNLTESDVIFFDTSLESLTRAHRTEGGEETDGDNQAATHGTKTFLARNSTARTVMATADFQASVGLPRRGRFSKEQVELIRAQVRAAHQHGLLARYTGIKCHPQRIRRLILRVLAQEGVDLIENDQNDCERPWRESSLEDGEGSSRVPGLPD